MASVNKYTNHVKHDHKHPPISKPLRASFGIGLSVGQKVCKVMLYRERVFAQTSNYSSLRNPEISTDIALALKSDC